MPRDLPITSSTSPTATVGSRVKLTRVAHFTLLVAVLVTSLAAIALMANGARWLLQESPAGANELVVASCAINAINGDACPEGLCTPTDTVPARRI